MKKICTTILFSMIIWLSLIANFSFAQTSPNYGDNRVIVTTGAISNIADWCDPYGSYVFYEWSPVYFLLYSEPLKTDNYWIFNDSIARKYGDIFSSALKIPFSSSVQPKNGTPNTPSNKIIVTQASDWIFTIPAWYSTPRTQPAWQLVTLTHYRLLRSTNPMITYYYTNFLWVKYDMQASANFSPNPNWKKACVTYYLGRCGDGVMDVAGWGIDTPEWFKTWHATSIIPAEQCDDGNTVSGDGCSSTCQNESVWPPTCSGLIVSPTTGNTTTQYDITCRWDNATSYSVSVTNSNGVVYWRSPLIQTWATFHVGMLGPLSGGANTIICTANGANGATAICPPTTVVVGVPVAPACTMHAYTTGGNIIPDWSTILENSSPRFRCELTNGAAMAANPYNFYFTLWWSPISTTPMPQVSSGYVLSSIAAGALNAACTINGIAGLQGSCAMALNVGPSNTTLQITKELVYNPLVPDGKYHPGDLVTFKINFANNGSNPATNVRVRDVFPNSLTHIATGDQLVGVLLPYNHGTWSNGTNLVIEYSGFYLPAGQSWYMIVKGIAKWYERANETYNHAYAEASNAGIKDAHLYFEYAIPNANVTINKTLSAFWPFYPGSTIGFAINIQNNGDSVNNLQIQDIRPNSQCIIPGNNYTSNIPPAQLQNNGNYSWTLLGAFNQGQTITINMTGQIQNDPICAAVGSYTNLGNYSYVLGGIAHTWSASLVFNVAPIPYANIDFSKTILQTGSNKWDTISYKITYINNGTTPLSNFVISDFRPTTLNYVTASPLPFNSPIGNSCANGCTLLWYPSGVLGQGDIGEIILTWTIK